jgi:hypothetical protein
VCIANHNGSQKDSKNPNKQATVCLQGRDEGLEMSDETGRTIKPLREWMLRVKALGYIG